MGCVLEITIYRCCICIVMHIWREKSKAVYEIPFFNESSNVTGQQRQHRGQKLLKRLDMKIYDIFLCRLEVCFN